MLGRSAQAVVDRIGVSSSPVHFLPEPDGIMREKSPVDWPAAVGPLDSKPP